MSVASPPNLAAQRTADERLAHAVTAGVRSRCGRSLSDFSVSVHQGVATLAGHVRGFYQKQVMLKAAQAVPGVQQVIDRVEVLSLEPRILLNGVTRLEAQSAA